MALIIDKPEYTALYNHIDTHKKEKTLEEIRTNILSVFDSFLQMHFLTRNDLNEEVFNEIIDELIEVEKGSKIDSLDNGTYNTVMNPPTAANSTWGRYRDKLRAEGWTTKSIHNIEKSSLKTLQYLSQNTVDTGPIKGLAIGNVQSGKTANMAGLMAMAGDYGFNFFIVLSGVIDKLREQTSNRIKSDLASFGNANLHWNELEKMNLKKNKAGTSNYDLSENSTQRFFTVTLKQKNRLDSLFKWLLYDKKKASQLKILIIDDEADQASINTNNIEDNERTTINRLITDFVNEANVKAMNYIGYTATPYGNVLNDNSDKSLYPSDFIVLLNPGEDYIGPTEVFGIEDPASNPKVDIARRIPVTDVEVIKEIHKGRVNRDIPTSFAKSINWFLISVAAMRHLKYKEPITMLVHTSFKKVDHNTIANRIVKYLDIIRNDYENYRTDFITLYKNEKSLLTRENFITSMVGYSSKDRVPDYPEWTDIEIELKKIISLDKDEYYSPIQVEDEGVPKYGRGLHISIDNSDYNKIEENEIKRLVYPTKNQMPDVAPAFIVIGGNTLSRGLTLEGLVSSYFLRNTTQADTLMQMGRWFGYRKGYEIFPRVWLDDLALERFEFIAQMNEEFRTEIKQYDNIALTPLEYAPRVRYSPNNNLLKLTSANKSQAAMGVQFDFTGFNSQTIYFENSIDTLRNNLKVTSDFLNSLDKPEFPKSARMIWRDIELENVLTFFEEYYVSDHDRKMSLIPELIDWLKENSKHLDGYEYDNWNVILSSKGDVRDPNNSFDEEWNIHGYSPSSVIRRKRSRRGIEGIASIGALRTPSDLLIDIADLEKIDKESVSNENVFGVRKKYGYDRIPQLLIYKVEKEPLGLPYDVIGINVMIPGFSDKKNITEYIAIPARRDIEERMIEEEDE